MVVLDQLIGELLALLHPESLLKYFLAHLDAVAVSTEGVLEACDARDCDLEFFCEAIDEVLLHQKVFENKQRLFAS